MLSFKTKSIYIFWLITTALAIACTPKKSHPRSASDTGPSNIQANSDLESADALEQIQSSETQPDDQNNEGPVNPFLEKSEYGIRTGTQYRNTILKLTGVPYNERVQTQYEAVSTALPNTNVSAGFDAGQQSAIIKLAAVVCNELIDSVELRAAFFPGIDFNTPLSDPDKNQIAIMLQQKFWGKAKTTVDDVLLATIVELQGSLSEGSDSKEAIIKGTCTAVAGSFSAIVL